MKSGLYILKGQLNVSERTALRYFNEPEKQGFITSEKIGRERIYKNERLWDLIKNFDLLD